ncbi:MAG: SprT family zinc-dependent metalloprotease [Vicinamibacteria bacterium]
MTQLSLGEMTVEVIRKKIKNIHLSVHPPGGRVRIAAPFRVALDTLRSFAIAKLGWIRKQQARLRKQERETPREYLDRESHFVWGTRYLLRVEELNAAPRIELGMTELVLRVRPRTPARKRAEILEAWHRDQLKTAAEPLFRKWEPIMGVKVGKLFTQRMRTRWGTCNTRSRSIRLNTELVKKPRECLEYVVVHEMVHLLEPSHNARLKALMSQYMTNWAVYRQMLNRLPVRHEDWVY